MWDPEKYLGYADLRARPFYELLARVGAERPRRVVDLGCGPGNLTGQLRRRWPEAALDAVDSSPEMVRAANEVGVAAVQCDVRDFTPAPDTDVVISNAVLQWVPEHRELMRSWAVRLPAGAWLAVQLPGNLDAPSHTLIHELASSPEWAGRLDDFGLRGPGLVDDPEQYADLLADAGCVVDAWETTYVQRLTGADPVLHWVSGTTLRPIRSALDEPSWQRFQDQLAALLAKAYPRRADGVTWLPFRRVFAVAQCPGESAGW